MYLFVMQKTVLFITRNPEKLGNAVIKAIALFNFSNFEIILNPIDKGHDRNSLSPLVFCPPFIRGVGGDRDLGGN